MRFMRPPIRVLLCFAVATVAACGDSTGPDGPEPNFVRLESDAGDWIGAGESYSYTQENAVISVTASAGLLSVAIEGDEWWYGDFQLPGDLERLEPGTWTGLQRYPFHDPAEGGLDWSGEGRGCNTLTGSLTIDAVTYEGDLLTAIDLTFEQHCEGGAPALHGTIHWRADDSSGPAGPTNPPSGLWQPPAGSTPATGDYVYLESDAGDYIGGGLTYGYTEANATIAVVTGEGRASVSVDDWNGEFKAMSSLDRLQPGYYGDLSRFPFHNPMKGGLDWSGQGRGCNTLSGWFVVDRVTYVDGVLTALELRFEQHCEEGTPALRGKIRWGV